MTVHRSARRDLARIDSTRRRTYAPFAPLSIAPDGDRVRERLQALLPFEVIVTERGFVVRTRLLANPAKPHLSSLEEFRPIPSLLRAGPRERAYRDGDGERTLRAELNDQFVV